MEGIIDVEDPVRRVVREIRRARRWKFWEEIRLRLGSLSGSGVPVRDGGELTDAPKVTAGPGVGVGMGMTTCAGAPEAGVSTRCISDWLSPEVGNAIGAEMGVDEWIKASSIVGS